MFLVVRALNFILWNPTTKKSLHLPEFHDDFDDTWGNITKYGFGFDELNDDYRVFGVLSVLNRSLVPIRKVYSLRSNSWEIIEEEGAYFYEGKGTYLSGKLHWNTLTYGIIVSFDLNSKVYGVVELPSYLENGKVLGLGVLSGCLSVHCFHREGHVDIWVMKEYGVKEYWDKVVTIPFYLNDVCSLSIPFTIGLNGEILLIYSICYESTLLIYNPKGNVCRRPRTSDNAELTFYDWGMYVESLASVVPDAQQEN